MAIKKPDIRIPSLRKDKDALDDSYGKVRATSVERSHSSSVVLKSVLAILIISALMFVFVIISGEVESFGYYMNNIFCNTIALVVVVVFLDTIVSSNREGRKKRDECRAILRHNRLIQPDIDMFLVRKNMVVTPEGATLRKFQAEVDFTIKDMKDMYSPSILVSDVGMSKINRYAYYQSKLKDEFEKIIESVDFTYYPEISEAVLRYINATSYGDAALQAVVSYENMKQSTRSVRVMVVGMIRDEPEDGRFMDADPMMKNVYLVNQTIKDQQRAVSDYLRLIRALVAEDPSASSDRVEYE